MRADWVGRASRRAFLGGIALVAGALARASACEPQAQEAAPTLVIESISGRSRLECTESRLAESRVGRYAFFRERRKVWERELPIVLRRFVLKDDGSFEGVGLRGGEKAELVLAAVDPKGVAIERRVVAAGDVVAYCTAGDFVIHAIRDSIEDGSTHRLLTYRWGQRDLDSETTIRMCPDPEDGFRDPAHSLVSLQCTEDGRSILALWEVPNPRAIDTGLVQGMGNVLSVFDRSGAPIGCFAIGYASRALSEGGCRLDGRWPEYEWATWGGRLGGPGMLRVVPSGAERERGLRIAVDRGENGEARVRVAKRPRESVRTEVAVSPTGRSRLECFQTNAPTLVGRYTFLQGVKQVWERDLPIVLEKFVVKDDGSFEGAGLRTAAEGGAVFVLAAVDASGVVTERRVEERRLIGPHVGFSPSWRDVSLCAKQDLIIHGLEFRVDNRPQNRLLMYRWGRPGLEGEIVVRTCLDAPEPNVQPYGRIDSIRCTADGGSIFVLWSVRASSAVDSAFGDPPPGAGNLVSVYDRAGEPLACFAMGDAIRRLSEAGCRLDRTFSEYAWATWEADGSLGAVHADSGVDRELRIVVERGANGTARVRVDD